MECATLTCEMFAKVTLPFDALETTLFGSLTAPTRRIIGLAAGVVFMMFWFVRMMSPSSAFVQFMDAASFVWRILLAFILMGTQDIWITVVKHPVNEMVAIFAAGSELPMTFGKDANAAAKMVDVITKALNDPIKELQKILVASRLGITDPTWWGIQIEMLMAKVATFFVSGLVFAMALLYRFIEALFFGLAPFLVLAWAFVRTEFIFTVSLRLYLAGAFLMTLYAIMVGAVSQFGQTLINKARGVTSTAQTIANKSILSSGELDAGTLTEFLTSGDVFLYNMSLSGVFVVLLFLSVFVFGAAFFLITAVARR